MQPDRYAIIPRTLSFVLRGDQVLLIRVAANRGAWAGRLNGIGGHVEQGEDPLSSARREIAEETGLLVSDLRLCGAALIDVGSSPGIGLFMYVGRSDTGEAQPSLEGEPVWVRVDELAQQPLVEDLPIILSGLLECYRNRGVLSASYHYDSRGELRVEIAN